MGSEVCPACGAVGRRYGPRWHYNCGSDVTEKDVFYPSVKCLTTRLASRDARIAALTEELERVKAGVAKSLDIAYAHLKDNALLNVSHGQFQRILDARDIITAQINLLRTGSALGDFPAKAKEPT